MTRQANVFIREMEFFKVYKPRKIPSTRMPPTTVECSISLNGNWRFWEKP
jgi:hypothetical protein